MDGAPSGVYRHWKGGLYQVVGVASDANSTDWSDLITASFEDRSGFGAPSQSEVRSMLGIVSGVRKVVVYRPLEHDHPFHSLPELSVRNLSDFNAWVCTDPTHAKFGQPMTTGTTGPCLRLRFEHIGDMP